MNPLTILRALRRRLRENTSPTDHFLEKVAGVIHVGANSGQERDTYRRLRLRVLWVEPIPQVYETLCNNIAGHPLQRAVQALVTDQDDAAYQFNVSSNEGQSSSILELKQHRDIWPDVSYVETIPLTSVTLPSLLAREKIAAADYDALVLDTQGSELLVLKGALPLLPNFTYIKTEVADFESYQGCCRLDQVDAFMRQHGFVEHSRVEFARREQGGSYFEVVYRNESR